MSAYEDFHKHLDECNQCLGNPHGLCQKGHELIVAYALSRPAEQQLDGETDTCPACNGTKYDGPERDTGCSVCNGTGQV